VVVLGGSGYQGTALLAALVEQRPRLHMDILTVTRHENSSWAAHWRNQGVTVLEGDVYASDTLLQTALRGADALFLVTFSDFANSSAELAQGLRIARAAQQADVHHVAFSGGVRTGLPLMDAKADIEVALRMIPWETLSVWHTGFFYENLVRKGGQPRLRCELKPGDAARRYSPTHSPPAADSSDALGSGEPEDPPVLWVSLASPFPEDFPVVMHAASDVGRLSALHLTNALGRRQRQQLKPAPPPRGASPTAQPLSSPAVREDRWAPHRPARRIVGEKLSMREFTATVNARALAHGLPLVASYTPLPLTALEQLVPGARGGGRWGDVVTTAPARCSLYAARRTFAGVTGQRLKDMFAWVLEGGLAAYDSEANVSASRQGETHGAAVPLTLDAVGTNNLGRRFRKRARWTPGCGRKAWT
jgi:hypothetical protein